MINSSGLECETCLVHFKGIKGESERIYLKFVNDLMDVID